ncbi:MAG TPA: 2-amino-4-hydroxy-6-hydroxymethyldihydropteridine diphosphokinase [Vicinamibacterales bacterium]|nr:2-amino-4-hydroxy-6-hydroxymethyldihydropteridine diphosphokinase [Vicinamibacterales bacterium]
MAPSSPHAGSETDRRDGRVLVAIALGSNLGDRASHLTFACTQLAAIIERLRCSSFHETEPEDVGPQPRFLNAAAVGWSPLPAEALLDRLLAIERESGRERPFPGAPRTLDLDLVLYGGAIITRPGLEVPHPRFRTRRFVLAPLAEIAPDLVDPVTGLTVRELLDRLDVRR